MKLFLVEAFEQLVAEAINGFALLVHDVVVLEEVLAGFEVLRFDLLLCLFDAAGDHLRLDGDALFHTEALEHA